MVTADTCSEIRDSVGLVAVLGAQGALGALGLLSNALFLPLILRFRAFHPNIRLILASCSVAGLVNSGVGLKWGLDGVSVLRATGRNATLDAPPSNESIVCGIGLPRTAWRGLGILASSWGLIALSLERLFATVRLESYEKSRRLWLGISLVTLQWALPLIILRERLLQKEVPLTPFGLPPRPDLAKAVPPSLAIEVLAGGLFLAFAAANRRKEALLNADDSFAPTLSVRYQMRENLRATRMLGPVALFQALLFTVFYIVAAALLYRGHMFTVSSELFLTDVKVFQAGLMLPNVYGAAFPLVGLLGSALLRDKAGEEVRSVLPAALASRLPAPQPAPVADAPEEADVHFQQLHSAWR